MADQQGSLFVPHTDGHWRPSAAVSGPGRVSGDAPATSKAAAESVRGLTGEMRLRVLECIRSRGFQGATCDEVEQALGLSHQTASARIWELKVGNHVVDTTRTRKTRSGRPAAVYVVVGTRSELGDE